MAARLTTRMGSRGPVQADSGADGREPNHPSATRVNRPVARAMPAPIAAPTTTSKG
jgi:hypothetical protein